MPAKGTIIGLSRMLLKHKGCTAVTPAVQSVAYWHGPGALH